VGGLIEKLDIDMRTEGSKLRRGGALPKGKLRMQSAGTATTYCAATAGSVISVSWIHSTL